MCAKEAQVGTHPAGIQLRRKAVVEVEEVTCEARNLLVSHCNSFCSFLTHRLMYTNVISAPGTSTYKKCAKASKKTKPPTAPIIVEEVDEELMESDTELEHKRARRSSPARREGR